MVATMVTCPKCKKEVTNKSSKEWNFGVFLVKSLTCEHCGQKFRAYYRDNKINHTIPKNVKNEP